MNPFEIGKPYLISVLGSQPVLAQVLDVKMNRNREPVYIQARVLRTPDGNEVDFITHWTWHSITSFCEAEMPSKIVLPQPQPSRLVVAR